MNLTDDFAGGGEAPVLLPDLASGIRPTRKSCASIRASTWSVLTFASLMAFELRIARGRAVRGDGAATAIACRW